MLSRRRLDTCSAARGVAAAVVLALLSATGLEASAAARPPNVVFFLADDLGYADVGCFGSPTIRTPNIDALASGGKRFTSFYAPASICSPSRAGFLTGRLPIRSGVFTALEYPFDNVPRVFFPVSFGSLPDTEITIPGQLKQAGYASAIIGKWHLGHYNDSLPTYQSFGVC